MNPYKVLGVKKKATLAEIRQAYIDLSKQYHPDIEGGSQEKFVEIQKAYEILKDDALRASFDETGTIPGDRESLFYNAAVANLMQMFNDFLTHIPVANIGSVDIVKMMRDTTLKLKHEKNAEIARLEGDKIRLSKTRAVIEKKLKRKRNKKSSHLFLLAIDQSIEQIDTQVLPKKENVEVMDKALEILNDYEFDTEDIKFIAPILRGSLFIG